MNAFTGLLKRLATKNTVKECQKRWNSLAREDAKYYIWSTEFDQPEEDFRAAGLKDFTELIAEDVILNENLPSFGTLDMLEIGCGVGRMSEFFSGAFKSVSAIDISTEMIASAQKRLAQKRNICFKASDGRSIPFRNRCFDLVFSFIVFQHIPSYDVIELLFAEANRVLREEGMFKVQLRGKELPVEARDKWYYGVNYQLEDALQLAQRSGFEVVKYDGVGERYFWLWLKKSRA